MTDANRVFMCWSCKRLYRFPLRPAVIQAGLGRDQWADKHVPLCNNCHPIPDGSTETTTSGSSAVLSGWKQTEG